MGGGGGAQRFRRTAPERKVGRLDDGPHTIPVLWTPLRGPCTLSGDCEAPRVSCHRDFLFPTQRTVKLPPDVLFVTVVIRSHKNLVSHKIGKMKPNTTFSSRRKGTETFCGLGHAGWRAAGSVLLPAAKEGGS